METALQLLALHKAHKSPWLPPASSNTHHNAGRSNTPEKSCRISWLPSSNVTFHSGKDTEGTSCTHLMKVRLKTLTSVPEEKFTMKYEQKLISYPYILIRSTVILLITQLIIPEDLYIQGMKTKVEISKNARFDGT